MPSLSDTLGSIPGYGGYQAARLRNQQQEHGELQQAMNLQGLLAKIQQAEQQKALMADPAKLKDPDFWSRLAVTQNKPEYETHAERLRKEQGNATALETMRGVKTVVPPDPQEVAQGADQGSPVPQTSVMRSGGIFDDLTQSTNEQIATQAKALKAAMERNSSLPPQYWQTQQSQLAARETTLLNRPEKAERPEEPLHQIVGPNGKPVWVRRSEAVGKEPFHSGMAATSTPGDFTKSGEDYLKSIPEADRELVRKIARYEIDPKTLSTRGGQRERALSMVSQFDPTYDDTQYANKRRAIAQFGSGPQGNTVRSLNVAIEHIDTLQRAADAMKNGQFTPGNMVYNEVAKVFGVTPPNTFEGIRDIVANEVVKGTIGNAGALADRAEAASKIKTAASPEQMKELLNGWVELMGGQVKGLQRQYEGATGLKDFHSRYLTERARSAIATAEAKAGAPASGGAYSDAEKERRYQEWKAKQK